MNDWKTIPEDAVIQKTADALTKNGLTTTIIKSAEEAKKKVLEMIPEGSEVQANTSITLEQIGILDIIDNSGQYNSVRKKIFSLDRERDTDKIREFRSTQEYALGSAHAVTQNGTLIIASNSGSQIPGEAFGAKYVIFVVGAHKIVQNTAEGIQRIEEYIMPLESVRARQQYHLPETWNTYPSKILHFNREPVQNRVHVLLVKEVLGY